MYIGANTPRQIGVAKPSNVALTLLQINRVQFRNPGIRASTISLALHRQCPKANAAERSTNAKRPQHIFLICEQF
jgi:dihydroorotate dehydrogenase